MPIKNLKGLYEIIYGENVDHLSMTEIKNDLRIATNKQDDIWRKSNCTDYSIYSSENYLAELITGYYACSRPGMQQGIKFIKELYPTRYKKLTYFDDYPGIGLSTLHLLDEGLNVSIRHDVNAQIRLMRRLLKAHSFDMPYNDKTLAGNYDVVFSFEIIEHCTSPLEYVELIDRLLKPGGILVETSGFGAPKDGPLAGHFASYDCAGVIVPSRTTGRRVTAMRTKQLGYKLMHVGFNSKPRIWQKPK